MFLLVTLTGAAGFLASVGMLHAGVNAMWIRYPAAVGLAYLVFLFLLWLWLRTSGKDYVDFADPSVIPSGRSSPGATNESIFAGKGGEADGGGASGWFETPDGSDAPAEGMADSVGEALGAATQAEEFSIPLVAIILVAAVALSSLFVIYSAPILFAELLVDGVLAASLYRRLRGIEQRHWLTTAVRRTFMPFVLTACFMAAGGWAMTIAAPGAKSIGTVFMHAKQGS